MSYQLSGTLIDHDEHVMQDPDDHDTGEDTASDREEEMDNVFNDEDWGAYFDRITIPESLGDSFSIYSDVRTRSHLSAVIYVSADGV